MILWKNDINLLIKYILALVIQSTWSGKTTLMLPFPKLKVAHLIYSKTDVVNNYILRWMRVSILIRKIAKTEVMTDL